MNLSRPDQCPQCGSLNYIALNADGTRYNPFLSHREQLQAHGHALWVKCKCEECGHTWPFRIVHIAKTAS